MFTYNMIAKFYHKMRINLPVYLVLFNLSIIYTIYMLEYILPMMKGENFLINNISNFNKNYSEKLGLALFIIMNWLLFWLLISYFRTILANPGYLPDPMELEIMLVMKNLDFQPSEITERRVYSRSDSSMLTESDDSKPKLYSMSEKRQKYLNTFYQFVEEGPMTSNEIIRYRSNLEKYIVPPPKRMMSASDLYITSDTSSIIADSDDLFDHFRGVDLSKINLCSYCIRWKVERSHHCKQCGKCVLKMDHHCPWVANCIGFRNHKFFCLLIIYGLMTSSIIFFTFWEVIFKTYFMNTRNIIVSAFYLFVYLLDFGFLCFMVYLFKANWKLIFSNQTVIERAEREKFGQTKYNFYDKGKYSNFVAVFGENPLFWFFPFYINEKGKGLVF
jgi:hypothetical protein